jgi:D-alanyl-D-alanine carboxypeptidase
VLTLSAAGDEPARQARPTATSAPDLEIKTRSRVQVRDRVLLAWSPGAMPPGSERFVEKLPGVVDATTVVGGLDWMKWARAEDGTLIDAPKGKFAIPIEMAVIEPTEYAAFAPAADQDAILRLAPGDALMADTESELRGHGTGLRMRLTDRTYVASSVVSDEATNGYELLVAGSIPDHWITRDRFVLMKLGPKADRSVIERRMRAGLVPGRSLRVRADGEVPFLRFGDAVLPQLTIKATFGEFAAKPQPDGTIDLEKAWYENNIRFSRVPILGRIMCHRAVIPQVRAALREVVQSGLAYLINKGNFGGCFSPRFVNSVPMTRLSHHSWGIAFDINVAENAYGTRPDLDPRLVALFENDWGFTWGGRWQIPDGMHFEWVRFP